jgi:hypothetical protein
VLLKSVTKFALAITFACALVGCADTGSCDDSTFGCQDIIVPIDYPECTPGTVMFSGEVAGAVYDKTMIALGGSYLDLSSTPASLDLEFFQGGGLHIFWSGSAWPLPAHAFGAIRIRSNVVTHYSVIQYETSEISLNEGSARFKLDLTDGHLLGCTR